MISVTEYPSGVESAILDPAPFCYGPLNEIRLYRDATLVFPGTFFALEHLHLKFLYHQHSFAQEAAELHQKLNLLLRRTKVV